MQRKCHKQGLHRTQRRSIRCSIRLLSLNQSTTRWSYLGSLECSLQTRTQSEDMIVLPGSPADDIGFLKLTVGLWLSYELPCSDYSEKLYQTLRHSLALTPSRLSYGDSCTYHCPPVFLNIIVMSYLMYMQPDNPNRTIHSQISWQQSFGSFLYFQRQLSCFSLVKFESFKYASHLFHYWRNQRSLFLIFAYRYAEGSDDSHASGCWLVHTKYDAEKLFITYSATFASKGWAAGHLWDREAQELESHGVGQGWKPETSAPKSYWEACKFSDGSTSRVRLFLVQTLTHHKYFDPFIVFLFVFFASPSCKKNHLCTAIRCTVQLHCLQEQLLFILLCLEAIRHAFMWRQTQKLRSTSGPVVLHD